MKIILNYCTLLRAIKLTKGFCGNKESRPILQNIKIEAANNAVTFWATDAYKVVKHEITDNIEIIESGSVNVLPKELEGILKLFKTLEFEKVTLETTNDLKFLTISYLFYVFKIRVSEKEYPNLINVMPKEDNLQDPVHFDTQNLKILLNSLSINGNNSVLIRFNKDPIKPAVIIPNCLGEKTTAVILPVRRS